MYSSNGEEWRLSGNIGVHSTKNFSLRSKQVKKPLAYKKIEIDPLKMSDGKCQVNFLYRSHPLVKGLPNFFCADQQN